MIKYHYHGFHGCHSVCGLEIQALAGGKTLVICTELPGNPGTSVTNFTEDLATIVCRQYGIRHDMLVWIEHYPASESYGPEPGWDKVEFTWDGKQLQHTRWRAMRPLDWQLMGIPVPDA